jgi:hypothetical protein
MTDKRGTIADQPTIDALHDLVGQVCLGLPLFDARVSERGG